MKEMFLVTKDFLEEVRRYCLYAERFIDGEIGACRDFDELIADGMVPEIYHVAVKLLDEGAKE